MTSPRFTGVVPPIVTPMTADGAVDVASLERLVSFLLDAGVTGLFVLGSSGETAYLTDDQRTRVLEVVIGATAGQVPVIAGAIETTTNRVVERAAVAAKLGADAVVATAPFYVRTHDTEIDRHFRAIAAAVDLPLLAYDVPVCVHTKLSTDLLLDLAADGVLAGVKDSSGDDVAFRRLCLLAPPEFALLTGHEVVVDAMLLGGAHGAVPGLGNVDPHGYVRLHAAASAGDWTAARAEQDRLARLFSIVFAAQGTSGGAAGVGAFKTALALRGIIAGNAVSAPMRSLDAAETAAVRALLDEAGL
ncbi:4-hydroxy-tetrahydrodipicolinate synthase [Alloactinosynnema sp. L-07]|uniref:dihydrodipicolinate synthase family protein n=1 Tax=Alloactinosynnema sp. L-07 TaxID=1653480 RepID=UPI00065EF422|nr:dihydrodipicolinate synthase family protein [Alloactinosynnema sp. L-07]CRK56636.1 4-hydroxy-tetrahydrodipicolinate synthase [Alloactinosynnema sp. L-07]